ncbi:hypothetical protein [Burkholderia sp. S-53]|uniref:hypothetical protein n=1 Tax=Burkholderia sp. S-53 TaxID=2906514 RepID=UPI0021D300BC|nr:hypothetical protein [Burkholderia sp. S-53]UXU85764.1 hypothetical protein LXM88_00230 [Burkholderia sp. S-53]
MPLFGRSFERHFVAHPWSQGDVLGKTRVREAQDGMCLALTIDWLSYMKKHHASVEASFSRLISDRTLLKQLAGQQRHYVTNPLSALPRKQRGPISSTELVELASKDSLTLGFEFTPDPAHFADVIANEIERRGHPVFYEVGIYFKTGIIFKERAGHSIGIAVDAYGTLALFDPNYGLATIQKLFSGSVQRGGTFDEVMNELISTYEVKKLTYNCMINI